MGMWDVKSLSEVRRDDSFFFNRKGGDDWVVTYEDYVFVMFNCRGLLRFSFLNALFLFLPMTSYLKISFL